MKKNILLFVNLFLPFLVFSQTLVSISPSSADAGQTLNITITGTGTKFTQSNTPIVTLSGTQVNSVTVINDLTIEANISIPANAVTGDYHGVVSQQNNQMLAMPVFHINGIQKPLLTSLSPSIANNGQTLDIILTGKYTHFLSNGGTTNVYFDFNLGLTEANSITPLNDTLIKVNLTVPVAANDGYYSVYYYNSVEGNITLKDAFQVTGNPRPVIVAISPNQGYPGRTFDIILTSRFMYLNSGNNTVEFGFKNPDGTAVVNSTTVLSDTTIKVNITVPSLISSGDYNVYIYNSNGRIARSTFRIIPKDAPIIVDVNPKSATTKQKLDVTITGINTHFTSPAGVIVGFDAPLNGVAIINSVNVLNDSSLIANITIPHNIQTGNYDVIVNNVSDGQLRLTNGFHITQLPPSTIASITPNTADTGQTLDVTIKGVHTHFGAGNGTKVAFYFAQASGANTDVVNSITVLNDTVLTANITVPGDVYTGDYGFSVESTIDGPPIHSTGFHVNGRPLPPAASVNPSGIPTGETTNITIKGIRGTHFNQPASKTTVNFVGNRTITINSKTVVNDSVITLNITTPGIAGGYQVFVNDSIDGQVKGFFKVYPKCFAFFKTTYSYAFNIFTLHLDSVSSLATSFNWNFGDGTTSTDSFPTHIFAEDKIYNVCLQISNTAGDSCSYCHEMGKDSLGNPIFKTKGFSLNVKRYKTPVTGIPSYDKDEHFIAVYPNPADDIITISSSTPISALNKPVLSIYSIEGKLLLQQAFVKEKIILDVSAFQKGMYIMQLTGSKQTETIKFVKE